MPSDRDEKDIEIIPPDATRSGKRDPEWVYISVNGSAYSFKDLPLHKRIMLIAAWLGGLLVAGFMIFLVVASAVLIWIPLLLAIAAITAFVLFFRTKFRRR
ncbi:MAG: hypothetical protein KF826_09045 [Xanthobacteraceae bacterium]|nr:hypothetical protein [Xanthobacteraceae bacterium]MBX3534483.1 hypothetical protein [Xanthobacteraceae bacterium]MBX3547909.1 hypothetical protein [Xanthobacteraceae bacterium]MCW5674665.1 hypothetical protein [Xanthobacteraceae bacterium]MCW5677014.1 hypothetical protein [Xanthobacteraceae bacterium]